LAAAPGHVQAVSGSAEAGLRPALDEYAGTAEQATRDWMWLVPRTRVLVSRAKRGSAYPPCPPDLRVSVLVLSR